VAAIGKLLYVVAVVFTTPVVVILGTESSPVDDAKVNVADPPITLPLLYCTKFILPDGKVYY
jgi:hypothetical protein